MPVQYGPKAHLWPILALLIIVLPRARCPCYETSPRAGRPCYWFRDDLPDSPEERDHGQQAGDQGDGEDPAQGRHLFQSRLGRAAAPQAVTQEGEKDYDSQQGAADRPGMIHRAGEAEG